MQYAAAQIGAILVNINPSYRAHELRYVLRQAGVREVFYLGSQNEAETAHRAAEVGMAGVSSVLLFVLCGRLLKMMHGVR